MPFLQQGFAIVIGRLRRVAQGIWCVPVHTGFACDHSHAACGGCIEKRVHAGWMDRAKAGQRCGAMCDCQITGPACDLGCVIGVAKAAFFGESIGVEPVNKLLAPARNHRSLWVMHMRIDKACGYQVGPVIGDLCVRMGRFQRACVINGCNLAVLDQHSAGADHMHAVFPRVDQRLASKLQGRSK